MLLSGTGNDGELQREIAREIRETPAPVSTTKLFCGIKCVASVTTHGLTMPQATVACSTDRPECYSAYIEGPLISYIIECQCFWAPHSGSA